MDKAEELAKTLLEAAEVVKLCTGTGSITLEEDIEVDDYDKFLKLLDEKGYCLKPRSETHFGIFPSNEKWVIIEKINSKQQ